MTKSNANGSNATTIHISLQGKGGVGKSLVAAILSQYLASRGQDIRGVDADPVNHTLSEYRGIGARCLNILKDGSVEEERRGTYYEKMVRDTSSKISRLSMSSICFRYQVRPARTLPNNGMIQTALIGRKTDHWSNSGSHDSKI